MPAPQWRQPIGLIDQLLEDPHRFQFFQAVRLLERWLGEGGQEPDQRLPAALKFRNTLSLSFPASEIEALKLYRRSSPDQPDAEPGTRDTAPPSRRSSLLDQIVAQRSVPRSDVERVEITPAFMGFLGVSGTLPLYYTELLAQRELYQKDFAARSFMDLFSSRSVTLFYAAWKKHRLQFQYEADRKNRFLPLVLAMAGLGQRALYDRLSEPMGGVPDEALAYFAGALQQRALSARQFEQVLSGYLRVPVKLEQFCGRWYTLPPEARSLLGVGNGVLGSNALAGERVWQRDLRVRVVLGPLDHAKFRRFLPAGPGALALRELLTLLSGVSLEYEIKLVLRADAVRGSELASTRPLVEGRLGWDTYLQTQAQPHDRSDVSYDIHAAAA